MSLPSFDQPGLSAALPVGSLDLANVDHRHVETHLVEAYTYCAQLTRQHSKSFYFSTQLLPPDKRAAIRVLYAFCRTTDDLVDLNPSDPAPQLAQWRHTLHTPPRLDDPVPLAWADVVRRYELSPALEAELLAGVEMDLSITRYQTFADLWVYCYRVASVVGLLSMQILGYCGDAVPAAIKLGVALQLTNILRDIGEDAARNRIYLPLEDLAAFNVSEDDILAGVRSPAVQALLQFEMARAHQLYDQSWPGIACLSPDSRAAVATAAVVYRGILDKITLNRYDVFHQRAHLSLLNKCCLLPRVWWRLRALNKTFGADTDWSDR